MAGQSEEGRMKREWSFARAWLRREMQTALPPIK